jgi:hypothetical protein
MLGIDPLDREPLEGDVIRQQRRDAGGRFMNLNVLAGFAPHGQQDFAEAIQCNAVPSFRIIYYRTVIYDGSRFFQQTEIDANRPMTKA